MLTKYSSDPRPDQRVLYSCFAALGQLVEHHSSSLDDNQMNNMLSLSLQSIKSSANYLPCVTEQLIFTLSSVIEYSSQSFLETNIGIKYFHLILFNDYLFIYLLYINLSMHFRMYNYFIEHGSIGCPKGLYFGPYIFVFMHQGAKHCNVLRRYHARS